MQILLALNWAGAVKLLAVKLLALDWAGAVKPNPFGG